MKIKLLRKLRREAKKRVYLCEESNCRICLYHNGVYVTTFVKADKKTAIKRLYNMRLAYIRKETFELRRKRVKRLPY